MPGTFSTSSAQDLSNVQTFLLNVFGLTDPPPGLRTDVLAWKYLDAHPWWPEGRSYMLRADTEIAAHGAVTPVRFSRNGTSDNLIQAGQVIDWAAGSVVPGGGLLIYRRCLELIGGVLLAINGSADTRKIIPMLRWFKPKEDLRYYGRPIRPWRYLSGSIPTLARDTARVARGLGWKFFPRLPNSHGWRCRAATAEDDVFQNRGDFISIQRTRAWFDYLQSCPLGKSQLLILERQGKPAGHAFITEISGSVRVGDFVAVENPTAAFSAVLNHLAARPSTTEVLAGSSLREVIEVFEACGMRERLIAPVWVADPRKLVPEEARWEINLLIGDAYYAGDPHRPYLC